MKSISDRAVLVFDKARERVLADCKGMHAEHSAKGLLGNGKTAKRAVVIFKERMLEALNQLLGEAAKMVEHRGRAWTKAMSDISEALDFQIEEAPALLEPSFKLARLSSERSKAAVHALIDKAGIDLREELTAFKDGWTAPQAKRWAERHPTIYAIVLLTAGAAIGAVITAAAEMIGLAILI